MDVMINYSPDAVYDAIITKAPASEDFIVLAYASDTGILVTGELTNGDPEIAVYQDDDELYREPIISYEDGLETARDIYDQYLTDRVYDLIDDIDPFAIPDEIFLDDEIMKREESLDTAFGDMLVELLELEDPLDLAPGEFESLRDMLKEVVCEATTSCGYTVRRPSWTKDSEGNEVFTEYPYDT